ncbi:hypothetical protein CIHG_02812 [Coccidioides immitis H538.4]|uniref:Uncharacterized protein n=1 Tax=Coccidioides immitis H538.4 TaxID=396776 RepID=A0A0J8RM42_COCIT|nr:hypothetical protein CIHG_02812 [Coccidioides immitis H538.4]
MRSEERSYVDGPVADLWNSVRREKHLENWFEARYGVRSARIYLKGRSTAAMITFRKSRLILTEKSSCARKSVDICPSIEAVHPYTHERPTAMYIAPSCRNNPITLRSSRLVNQTVVIREFQGLQVF